MELPAASPCGRHAAARARLPRRRAAEPVRALLRADARPGGEARARTEHGEGVSRGGY